MSTALLESKDTLGDQHNSTYNALPSDDEPDVDAILAKLPSSGDTVDKETELEQQLSAYETSQTTQDLVDDSGTDLPLIGINAFISAKSDSGVDISDFVRDLLIKLGGEVAEIINKETTHILWKSNQMLQKFS